MTEHVVSPLRRRMIEDMTLRTLAPKTRQDSVHRVKEFVATPFMLGMVPFGAGSDVSD